jgi:protease I
MSHIAVLIGERFEDSEYTEPVKAFRAAGHEVVHLGLKAGSTVTGKREGTEVRIERAVAAADPSDYDALLIPGGYSPDHLRAYDGPVRFVRAFMESGKPVFAICHGPQLLITAQVIKGRRVTGWRSIVQDLKNAGAEFVDAEVVVDDNLVTSRRPSDLPAFIEESLKKMGVMVRQSA